MRIFLLCTGRYAESMPRTADHDARRTQIIDAVRGLVASDGPEAATMSRIAASAGVSVGLVQHYYASKDVLLADAYDRTLQVQQGRIETLVASEEQARGRIEHMVLGALTQFLPLDHDRRDETILFDHFSSVALRQPSLREAWQRTDDVLLARLREAVVNAEECGEAREGVDPDDEARRLLAVTRGLARTLLLRDDAHEVARVRRVLAQECASTFPNPCRQYGS